MALALSVALLAGAPAAQAGFEVGAAVSDYTPPPFGTLASDPADCLPQDPGIYTGPRAFSFMEPYSDQNGDGHYSENEPFLDCNANERWDGNMLGGGSNAPRFYTSVLDPVGARAFVVSNGQKTIAVEVLDHEGLFNVYMERIRDRVAADGYHLDGVYISSTHDESAPDSLGLYGVNATTSSVNDYWNDYLVEKSAQAIEQAYDARRPATVRYVVAEQPQNMRQCWSSYPFVDNMRVPVLQALDSSGNAIVTLGNVSQHAETLGFNSDPAEKAAISSDWPHFFRQSLEQRFGGVAIQMAGAVGSVESPQVFAGAISQTPQRFISASHPACCRTLFDPNGSTVPLGYNGETRAYGEQVAAAIGDALGAAQTSQSEEIWGDRRDACIPLTNALFAAGAAAGIFAQRPGYTNNCTVEIPPSPNGSTGGNEIKTQVAAFQIGDGEFISLPGEVFPFTYWRSFLGPNDMPFPQYGMPDWPLPHMHSPYRFANGLGEDMIGYIFPRGNGVGVPGEDPNNPSADSTDRFGCGHSDDSEAASSQAADILAGPLISLLDSRGDQPERVVTGRYVLPDGSFSRDPLGRPVLKCNVDQTYQPSGPAIGVFVPGFGFVRPTTWMALDGRPQAAPDRNTRGYIDGQGKHVWLDVFPNVNETPVYPRPGGASPLRVPLVPEFRACTAPNSSHVAPLDRPSCSPPALQSSLLTMAAQGRGTGFARFDVMPGDPGTPADEADVRIGASASDVRSAGGGDYAGRVVLATVIRITDRANGASADRAATVQDSRFSLPIACTPTPAASSGSDCNVSTTADTLVPGFAREGDRAVLSLMSVTVEDAGPDGNVGSANCAPSCGSGDESVFLRQGLFAP